MVFSTVFGSGLFSVLGAWVDSSTAVGSRSDVGGSSLFISDPAKKAVSADSKNTNTMLIIHRRARPHLEILEATDHNLSRIFSPSTNVQGTRIRANSAECKSEDPPAVLQHATIGIGRSAEESPRALRSTQGS